MNTSRKGKGAHDDAASANLTSTGTGNVTSTDTTTTTTTTSGTESHGPGRGPGAGRGEGPEHEGPDDHGAGRSEGPGHQGGGQGAGGLGDVFSFTLTNGAVTAASMQLPSGSSVDLAIGAGTGIALALSGSNIVASRTDAMGTDSLTFSDTDSDGFYEIVANSHISSIAPGVDMLGFVTRPQLTVAATADTVTSVSATLRDGSTKVLLSDTVTSTSAKWTLQQGLLVETHTNAAGVVQWDVYRDGNNDSVYTEVAHGHGTMVDLVGVLAATEAIATLL